MQSGFSALLDELDAAQRQIDADRETAVFVKSFQASNSRSIRAHARVRGQVDLMVKATEAAVAERALAERAEFRTRLAEAIEQADRACAAGQLTGEEAAKLDHKIASLAQRAQELEAAAS